MNSKLYHSSLVATYRGSSFTPNQLRDVVSLLRPLNEALNEGTLEERLSALPAKDRASLYRLLKSIDGNEGMVREELSRYLAGASIPRKRAGNTMALILMVQVTMVFGSSMLIPGSNVYSRKDRVLHS